MFVLARRPYRLRSHLLTALLVLCLPALAAAAGSAERGGPHTITVNGEGTASAPPDEALVQLGVEERSADAQKALAAAAEAMNAVVAALRGQGVAEADITTSEYSVDFVQAEQSSGKGSYRARDIDAVTIRSIGKLNGVLDAAARAGANQIEGIRFTIADSATLEMRARADAYAQAHSRALQLAALAGVALGPVQTMSESGGVPPISGPFFHASAAAAPLVSPGSLSVTVRLNIVYTIR